MKSLNVIIGKMTSNKSSQLFLVTVTNIFQIIFVVASDSVEWCIENFKGLTLPNNRSQVVFTAHHAHYLPKR